MNDVTSSQSVAIIDLGAGNLRSVHKAVERAAALETDNTRVFVTDQSSDIANADRIVLPGVGAFAACMDGLHGLTGMRDALELAVFEDKKPLLGICVGMQMFADWGREFGDHAGLGWIKGQVVRIDPLAPELRVPHMGWNQVQTTKKHDLFGKQNELSDIEFYFLHSFHFETETNDVFIGSCDYGSALVAAVAQDNILGTQFHPEKSQGAGLALLRNFLMWSP